MDSQLTLAQRTMLPDALRVLLKAFPREQWQSNPHFSGLVQFWLERHAMFRQLVDLLESDAQAAVEKKIDPQQHLTRVSRFGGMLVQQLHGHHQIEDAHYFPVLARLETGLDEGFQILDHDHHDLDDLLARFTTSANALLQNNAAPGAFLTQISAFRPFLQRHLEDEEDLIVPVILKHGPDGLH